MTRRADGKTPLSVECLSKVPVSESAIQVIYDLRDASSSNRDVLSTWLKNVCLSHERLRSELNGIDYEFSREILAHQDTLSMLAIAVQQRDSAQQELARLREQKQITESP